VQSTKYSKCKEKTKSNLEKQISIKSSEPENHITMGIRLRYSHRKK
jgi:hypothetical protein